MTEPSASRDVQDTLAAIERLLHRHKVITPEQALQAARLVTGDASFEFPPAAQPSPTPPPSPAEAGPHTPAPEPEGQP